MVLCPKSVLNSVPCSGPGRGSAFISARRQIALAVLYICTSLDARGNQIGLGGGRRELEAIGT